MTKTKPQNTKLASISNPQTLWGPSTAVKIPNPATAPPVTNRLDARNQSRHSARTRLSGLWRADSRQGFRYFADQIVCEACE